MMASKIEVRLTREEAQDFSVQLSRFLYSPLGMKVRTQIERALNDKDAWGCPTCGGTAWRMDNGK